MIFLFFDVLFRGHPSKTSDQKLPPHHPPHLGRPHTTPPHLGRPDRIKRKNVRNAKYFFLDVRLMSDPPVRGRPLWPTPPFDGWSLTVNCRVLPQYEDFE